MADHSTTRGSHLLFTYLPHTDDPHRGRLLAALPTNTAAPQVGDLEGYDPELDLGQYWERQVHDALFRYVAPVLLAVGSLGNLVSLVILRTPTFRGTSHALLLSALALADLGTLHTGLLRLVLKVTLDYDIRAQSTGGCKVHYFLTYYFPQMSSWTIVLVSLERLTSLCHPFKVKVICSKQRVVGAWVVAAVVLAVINTHWLVSVDLVPEYYLFNETHIDSFPRCTYPTDTQYFYHGVWTWLDFALLCFIPASVILPSNLVIMSKVYRASRARTASLGVNGASGTSSSVTGMLVVVSSFFVLTTTPLVIYYIGVDAWPVGTLHQLAQTSLAYSICNTLYYLNSSANFFLYCLSGTQFRVALSVTVGCRPATAALYRARSSSVNATLMTSIRGHATRGGQGQLLPKRSQSQVSLEARICNLAVFSEPVRKATSESCIT